ncbi:MAG: hypothetical protein E3J87_09905 [Candidatus Cloacimonadota bacterium]|nr:MAG: hypothetical protein E3J87_09905 [Candidatus Cloacimonadota bacterium]
MTEYLQIMSYGETWYLTVIPIFIAVIMHISNMNRMKSTYRELNGGVIRTRENLKLVRDAINLSMMLAIIYISMFVILFLTIAFFVFSRKILILTGGGHLFVFGIVTLPLGLWGRTAERLIKTLKVESEDPVIEKKYKQFLMQWEQPRLKLPD